MEEQYQNPVGMPPTSTNDKWMKGLTIAGYAASGVAVAGFIVLLFAVICDWSKLVESITLLIIFLSLLTSVTGIVASLIGKRWLLAGGGCASIVLSLAVGFFVAILIGAGQHHPPQRPDIDTRVAMEENLDTES